MHHVHMCSKSINMYNVAVVAQNILDLWSLDARHWMLSQSIGDASSLPYTVTLIR